ncbi:YDG domain-containing protein [Roseateles amylovorans]|uniref:YDG domain-containing protein n=1 Tax=Roseateles amylovorans TaxID=2978473 RepID=A0ABY6B4K8_9BURK|nr:YDG domain-containing protein [Roseateles amylovorans]UXH79864.1 YDG domain-containing protein [Roseateles amylovorans]
MGSMNHTYRLVWNELCGAFVAVPEHARGRGKRVSRAVRRTVLAAVVGAASASSAFALDAGALPAGAQIGAGQANFTQQGSQLRIDQQTQKLIVNWDRFDIGSGASVRFSQPSANAVALNRVIGGTPSQIFGDLSANGQVWLINNSGVVFGKGATVNVGGLVASTLDISDNDFLAGRARFSGSSLAQVRNEGTINAGGVVALLGASVTNTGTISAQQVALVAGQQVSLDFSGDGLLQVQVEKEALEAALNQDGLIQGQQVVLSAPSASALRASVINMDGVIEAKGLSQQGGRIVLDGGSQGQVTVSGQMDASSAQAAGGDIRVTGGTIRLQGAQLNASGATAGGQIHIGGGWQGKDATLTNAQSVTADAGTTLLANATQAGQGGEVVTWSDGRTEFAGRIEVRGGDNGGNGGRAEVSGKQELAYSGRTDARAAKGTTGDLLLDPSTLEIRGGGSGSGSLTDSVVYEKDIEAQQANVLLQATGDILVQDLNLSGGDGKITMLNNISLRIEAGTANGGHLTPPSNLTDGSFAAYTDLMFANASNTLEVFGTGSLMLVAGATNSGRVLNSPIMIAHGAGANVGTLPTHNVSSPGSGTPAPASITIYGADGATVGGSLTTNGGYVRIWADSDNGGAGFFTLNAPVSTGGGNLYVSTGSGDVTLNSSMILGAGRISFRADGSYTSGNKILAGLLSVSGDVTIDTPFIFKGGASIFTDSAINFGNVNVNMDTGTGVLTLRAARIDWGSSLLTNLSTASLRLEPFDPATNMVLGDANGFASATTLNKLPGIKNLTIGREDGTGTISVPGNFSFNASGSFEMVNRTVDITAGSVTNTSGNVILTGDTVNIGQAVTANGGTGKVTVRQMTAANELHLGSGLSNSSIGQINAATLEVGRSDGGNLVFDNDITTGATTVSLKSGQQVLGVNGGVAAANVAVTAGQGATLTDDTFNFSTLALNLGGGTTVIRPVSAAGYTIGTVDGIAGVSLRNGAVATVDAGAGVLALDGPINYNGGASTLTLQAPSWTSTANLVVTNGALATTVFDFNDAATSSTVGGATGSLLQTTLAAFNGTHTVRVEASDRQLVSDTIAMTLAGRLELLTDTWQQQGTVGVTTGGVLVRTQHGGLDVAQSLTAGGTVSLDERAAVGITTSAGTVTAGSLALRTDGDATLQGTHQVGVLAADVGSLTMVNGRSVTVGTADGLQGITADRTVDLRAQGATSDITLQQAVVVGNAGSAATPLLLAAGRNFINQAGANALQATTGDWRVYSTTPLNDTRGGLVANFKQYNATTASTVLGTGNGFLYTVAPTITGTLTGAAVKVYDGNTTATVAGSQLAAGGAIDGDTVNLAYNGAANYDTKNVASGKTVTVDGVSITGASQGGMQVYGYQLASTSASGAIGQVTPKTLTVVSGAVLDKVYDGNTAAQLSGTGVNGVVNGDTVQVGGTLNFLDRNAGVNKTVDLTQLGLTGADAGNYVLPTQATATITPRELTVTADIATKVYDATRTAQVSATHIANAVNGDDLSLTTAALFDTKNVGTGKGVEVQLGLQGGDAANYTLASSTVQSTGDVTVRTVQAPTVSVVTKTYDANNQAVVTVGPVQGVLAGDQLDATGSGTYDTRFAGTGKAVTVGLNLQGTDAGNYQLAASTVLTTGDITPKTVQSPTVTVVTKTYDGNTVATVSLGALQGIYAGDQVGASSTGSYDNRNAGTGKAVTVGLTLEGAEAANYTLANSTVQTTGNITPKTVQTPTVSVIGKTYDGNTVANVAVGALQGLVAGDQVGTGVTGSYDNRNAGTGKAVTVGLSLQGADAGNYTLSANSVLSTGDISQRTVAAPAVTIIEKRFDGSNVAIVSVGAVPGVLAGDQVGASGTATYATPFVGTNKPVTVGLTLQGADAGNYRLDPATVTTTGSVAQQASLSAVDALVVQPIGGNSTQNGGNGGNGNGGTGGGQGTTVATVAAGPSGNSAANVAINTGGSNGGSDASASNGGTGNGGAGNGANGGGSNGGNGGNGGSGNGGLTTGTADGGANGAANGGTNGGTNGGSGSVGNGTGTGGAALADGSSNGGNGANGGNAGNGSNGSNGSNGGNGGSNAAGTGEGNGSNGNGNGNGNGSSNGSGASNGSGSGTGSGSGDGAQGQDRTGSPVTPLGLEQTLRDGGQISLAVESAPYQQPLQSQLTVYLDAGEPSLKALGAFRVDDLGDSLALKSLQQAVPSTDRSSVSVTRRLSTPVTIREGVTATLDLELLADGTLRVSASSEAAGLGEDLVSALALTALKRQTGVAPTSVRAVVLRWRA